MIRIEQFDRDYVIHIDDKLTTVDDFIKMCDMALYRFKKIMKLHDRERICTGWMLRKRAGIRKNCKTFWHKDRPMWIPIVMKKAGVTSVNATMRLKAWEENGDIRKLFKKNIYFDSTTGEINTGRKKHTVIRKTTAAPAPAAPVDTPAPAAPVDTPTPAAQGPVIRTGVISTDDDEFSDLSHLSNKKRNGDTRLAKMKSPSKYEKSL